VRGQGRTLAAGEGLGGAVIVSDAPVTLPGWVGTRSRRS